MKKTYKIILIFFLLLLLTGCWDLIEIDERLFVSAIGIDIYTGDKEDQPEVHPEENYLTQQDRFVIIYSAPNLKALGKNPTSDKPRILTASISNNAYETTKEIATRTNRNLSFRHLKTFIIGEDVAKNPEYMKEIFDDLDRHELLSKKLSVLIAKGTAKEVMAIEDPFEPLTGYLIDGILKKKQGSSRYNTQNLNDILIELYSSGNALAPRVVAGKGEVKVAGSAIIKDYGFVGWLGEIENIAAMFFLDKIDKAVINANYKNTTVPFEISNSKTKYKLEAEGDKIKFIVYIKAEGAILEYKLDTKVRVFDEKTIKEVELLVEEAIKKEVLALVGKLQKEFKTDVLGVGIYIKKYKPDLWEDIKDDWDQVFTKVEIEVNTEVKARRIGMTK